MMLKFKTQNKKGGIMTALILFSAVIFFLIFYGVDLRAIAEGFLNYFQSGKPR